MGCPAHNIGESVGDCRAQKVPAPCRRMGWVLSCAELQKAEGWGGESDLSLPERLYMGFFNILR